MAHEELEALLVRARGVLDRYLFEADGGALRDDVAAVCMAIDDALPEEERAAAGSAAPQRALLERSAA